MGMFDYLQCDMPLPVEGHQERTFQTKDTPRQGLTLYTIHRDGSIWTPDSRRCTFTEVVRFHDFFREGDGPGTGWVEFEAIVVDGKVQEIRTVEIREE